MDNVKGFTNTAKINQEAAEWILLIEDTPKLSKEQIKALNQWVSTSDVHKECLTNMANERHLPEMTIIMNNNKHDQSTR